MKTRFYKKIAAVILGLNLIFVIGWKWPDAWDTVQRLLKTANTWIATQTFTNLVATTADINAGTVDATIGGTTPAAGTFTTLDTGQGANELYGMNQNVQTTDAVTFGDVTVGASATDPGLVVLHDAGTVTFHDDGNNTNVVLGPVNDGTTVLPITGSISATINVSGATYGSDSSITDAELLTLDNGATTEVLVGGGAGSAPVWTAATGSGAPVRATSPTLTTPILSGDLDAGGNYAVQLQNIPDLASRGPAYWFDGVDDYVSIADNANLDMDTNDFSLIVACQTSDATGNIAGKLLGGGTGYLLSLINTNVLRVVIDDNTTELIWDGAIAINDGMHHVLGISVDRDSATGGNMYIDGVADTVKDVTTVQDTLANAKPFAIGIHPEGLTSNPLIGSVSRTLLFNLALTAAEVKALSSGAEVPYKYVGASQTSIVTGTDSDFSGANNWVDDNLTSFDNTTGGVLTLAGDNGAKCHLPIANATTIIGKRYRLSFTVDSITAQWRTWEDAATTSWTIAPSTTGFHSVEFTATTIGGIWIRSDADGNAIVIDNITLTQIGCVLNLNPSGIGHNTWADSGGNELHGTVSGAIPTALPANHREKYIDLAVTGNGSFVLPMGYKIKSIIVKETAAAALTGGLDVGLSANGVEIVSAMAVGASATVLCTLVESGTIGATFTTADDTIYYSDGDDDANWNGAELELRVEMERITLN